MLKKYQTPSVAAFTMLFVNTGAFADGQACQSNIPATAPDSRFTDNGDGTVTDSFTKLIWKKCVEGQSGANCQKGSAKRFTWKAALQCSASTDFAGSKNWRLPNVNELESLVERSCAYPAINAKFFPNTSAEYWDAQVWTSSPMRGGSGSYYKAWSLDFSEGGMRGSTGGQVRFVRDGK